MFHESIPTDIQALLPILVLVAFGALLPLIGAFRVRAGWLAGIATVGILLSALLLFATLYRIPGLEWMPGLAGERTQVLSFGVLEMTPFVVLFDLVFLAVALIVTLGSPRYIARRHQGEYYGLILLSVVGMMVVAASLELVTLFVGLELSSFCTYALAGFFKRRLDSSEAAMKYFLVGSISSSLAIFGISIVYGLTGSTTFEALASVWSLPAGSGRVYADAVISGSGILGVFTWGLLLAGFGYKVAIVPFHNYVADVYEGAPSTVGGFLAAASKQMGFVALFKVFLLGLLAIKANWEIAIGVLAILTMVIGNVVALQQTNIKRMLAYSSIAQAGYILMALAIGTEYALTGGLFHIVTYSFMKAGAFVALAAAASWGIGEELSDWKGMGKRAPYLAFAMAVFMLSFAGIPPLAGFASKFVLFSSAIEAGSWYIWLAVFGIVTSAISLVYYWRVIRVMYVEESEGRHLAVAPSAWVGVFIGLVATILLGLWPALALTLSERAADALFAAMRL